MESMEAKTKLKEPVTKFGEDILDPNDFIFKISKQTYLIFLLEIKRKSIYFEHTFKINEFFNRSSYLHLDPLVHYNSLLTKFLLCFNNLSP
jgi:hypothetical protein